MATYSFCYSESEKNKDLWKAIKCPELTLKKDNGFVLATIFADTEELLSDIIDENFDVLDAIMSF